MAKLRRRGGEPRTQGDQSKDTTRTEDEIDEAAHSGLIRQLGMLTRDLLASRVGSTLIWLVAAIFVIIVANAYGQILLNRWNKPFYDALSRRDLRDFLFQLGVFFLIAGSLLILVVV